VDDGLFERNRLDLILRQDVVWAPLPADLEQRVLRGLRAEIPCPKPRTKPRTRAVPLDVQHLNRFGESS
jgi:hypothetical protein